MLNPDLTTLSTANLSTRRTLARAALPFVWCGAIFAIGASLYSLGLTGELPTETFFMALIASLVSIPVWREKKLIETILVERETMH